MVSAQSIEFSQEPVRVRLRAGDRLRCTAGRLWATIQTRSLAHFVRDEIVGPGQQLVSITDATYFVSSFDPGVAQGEIVVALKGDRKAHAGMPAKGNYVVLSGELLSHGGEA